MDFDLLNWSDQWMMWTGEKGPRGTSCLLKLSLQLNEKVKNMEILYN